MTDAALEKLKRSAKSVGYKAIAHHLGWEYWKVVQKMNRFSKMKADDLAKIETAIKTLS